MILLGYGLALAYAAVCLVLSVLFFKLGMPRELTRKFVHIFVGFEWVILFLFFDAGWHTVAVCAFFLMLLTIAYFRGLMPMISSDKDNAPGTVYYAVSMTCMAIVSVFVPDLFLPFGVAVVCTSLGDGFAGVCGTYLGKNGRKFIGNKTYIGFIANFVISFLSVLVFSYVFNSFLSVTDALWIAAFSATLEIISSKGLDNITVPLGVCALAYLLAYVPLTNNYVVPVVLTPFIIVFVWNRRILSVWGILAAVILDAVITVAFGNIGFIILLMFLVLGVLSDKVKNKITGQKSDKTRSEKQVVANGAVACICALAYIVVPRSIFTVAFVAALAEALSDTVSSGVGAFSKNTYDIVRMKKCRKGISGGVSLIGTLSGAIAAFILPLVAWSAQFIDAKGMLISGILALFGCLVDSVFGSILQVKYRCGVCGVITEEETHCDAKCSRYSGVTGVDNNIVNFLSNAVTAVLTMIFLLI